MERRILLVDDEPDILEFVGYNLRREGYVVRTAADGVEALGIATVWSPHLVLLDLMMPRMDGIETCRQLRRLPGGGRMRIVFLSARGEEDRQIEGFDSGADDYIPKPVGMKMLLRRVGALFRRIDPTAALPASGPVRIDSERRVVHASDEELVLPRKEFDLLRLLCSRPGCVFTREEIYRSVWGNEVVVGDRTIDVHIRRLRRKIGDAHIRTAKGVGYKFEP